MMTEGSVFGEDFILCTFVLKDRRPCYTITYLELLVLPRYIVYKLLPRYPLQKSIVRKAQVRPCLCLCLGVACWSYLTPITLITHVPPPTGEDGSDPGSCSSGEDDLLFQGPGL